jgi:hypothetical protein
LDWATDADAYFALCGECPYHSRMRMGWVFLENTGVLEPSEKRLFSRYVRARKSSHPSRHRVEPGEEVPPEGLRVKCRRGHEVVVPHDDPPSVDGVFYLRSSTRSAPVAT